MGWPLADRAHVATRDTFGEAVTHTPASGPVQSVRAIFDADHQEVVLDAQDVPVTAQRPMLTVRLADLTTAPRQGDGFTVGGVAYEATEVALDGQGAAAVYVVRA